MYVWLVTVGEPLPTDGADDRLLRAGILANMLVERGHKVVWWSSTFDHVRKVHRFQEDTFIDINGLFRIILLHSTAYKKNVSISRILNHYGIARKFTRLAQREAIPDVILCSLPTLELSAASVEYGKRNNVPVILDIRDLWPDIFLDLAPGPVRHYIKLLMAPVHKMARQACAGATAITGITPAFVGWGLDSAGRKPAGLDRDFPMGYRAEPPGGNDLEKAKIFWKKFGIGPDSEGFLACFFGTMGRQFDLKTVIGAARILNAGSRPFRFVLCGSGDNLEYYKQLARGCENVIFPGWVGTAEIWTMMRMSKAGLAPYLNTKNFTMNLPNKPVEYLSAGLPIVTGLKGTLNHLIQEYNCGEIYENGDAESLAAALIRMCDNPGSLKAMSENAYSLFQEKFVAGKVYHEMIEYLEHVSNKRNREM